MGEKIKADSDGSGKGEKRRESKHVGAIMVTVKHKDRWGKYSRWHSAVNSADLENVLVSAKGAF